MVTEQYIEHSNILELMINETQINSIKKSDITRTGLRIYKDGLIGIAGGIGNCEISKLENMAKNYLKLKIPYNFENTRECKEIINNNFLTDNNNFLLEFREFLDLLQENIPEFKFFNKVNVIDLDIRLMNSNNANLHYKAKFIDMFLGFKYQKTCSFFDGGFGYVGNQFNKKEVFKLFYKITQAYQYKINILVNKKRYPIIFFEEDSIIFSKLIDSLNGISYGTKRSLLFDKLEKKVFHKDFSFVQTAALDKVFIPFFDAEGIVNERFEYPLIENGVFINPYTDKRTAEQFKLPETGSAVCDYDGIPNVGLRKYRIKQSNKSVKELLNGEIGIVVFMSNGGEFMDNGDLKLPVQFALFYDGENFLGRVPPIIIDTNMFDMFNNAYIGTSKDSILSLTCEKCVIMDLEVQLTNT